MAKRSFVIYTHNKFLFTNDLHYGTIPAIFAKEALMLETFSTIALSIFMEGLFFLIAGVILSGIIEVYVSREFIRKIIPKNPFLALLAAGASGIIFPICECGIVPVVYRLLKKGVPLPVAVTILFASPIVNIIVIISTSFAFMDQMHIVAFRIAGGFTVAVLTGLIAHLLLKEKTSLKDAFTTPEVLACGCSHDHCNNVEAHSHEQEKLVLSNRFFSKPIAVIHHAIHDFFDTGKYFIIGILIASFFQSVIPREILTQVGGQYPLSNLILMSFAYILSVCSQTDAFIARSFLNLFTVSSLVSFMVFGAMLDIKTTLLLRRIFKPAAIFKLIVIVFVLNLLLSLAVELIQGGF